MRCEAELFSLTAPTQNQQVKSVGADRVEQSLAEMKTAADAVAVWQRREEQQEERAPQLAEVAAKAAPKALTFS